MKYAVHGVGAVRQYQGYRDLLDLDQNSDSERDSHDHGIGAASERT